MTWVVPPPRIPVANEGLGWDSLQKMVHNPGGDCYWAGGQPKLWLEITWRVEVEAVWIFFATPAFRRKSRERKRRSPTQKKTFFVSFFLGGKELVSC